MRKRDMLHKMQQIWQFQQQNNTQRNQTVWKIMLETKTLSKNIKKIQEKTQKPQNHEKNK